MSLTALPKPVSGQPCSCGSGLDFSACCEPIITGKRKAATAEQLMRARFDERFPERFPGIAITGIGDLGYGLNISFSDGHNRGIYPKSYLPSLAGP